jgi:hypothetical protein
LEPRFLTWAPSQPQNLKSKILSKRFVFNAIVSVDTNIDSGRAAAQLMYGSFKKPSVLHHKMLISVVFYHYKVILKGKIIKKWLKKLNGSLKSTKNSKILYESL